MAERLYFPATDEWREVDNEDIEAAVQQGAKPPSEVSIDVPLADGTRAQSRVPYEVFKTQSRNPDTVSGLTSEDTLRHNRYLAGLEDETSTGGSFLRSLGEELTFGVYEPSDEQRLADERFHPMASDIGKAIGIVGPVIATGGSSAGLTAAKGAATASRLARGASALSRAAGYLPGGVLARAGTRVAEGLGGRLAGHAVGAGVEEAGRATLRAMLDDDVELSGEAILDSALYGMAGGGIGYGVSKAVRKGIEVADARRTSSPQALSKLSDTDDTALAKRLSSNREPTPAQLGKTERQVADGIRGNVEKDVTLAGANHSLIKDVGELETTVRAYRDGPMAPATLKDPRTAAIIDRGLDSAKALRTYSRQPPNVQASVMASYGQHLQDVDVMADTLRRAGIPVDDLPTRFMPGNLAARQRAIAELTTTGSPFEDAANRLSIRLTQGSNRAQQANAVADALLSRIPIVGRLTGAAKDSPLASVAILDTVVGGGLGVTTAAAVGAKLAAKVIDAAYRSPGRGLGLSSMAIDGLRRMGLGGNDGRDTDVMSVVEQIRSTSPDVASQLAVQSAAELNEVSNEAVMAAGAAAARRQSALQRRLETIFGQPRSVRSLVRPTPTSEQVRALDRTLLIAGDPNGWAKLWSNDRLTRDDMRFAQQVWPSHVNRARLLGIDWLVENDGRTVPRSIRRRLELLLGAEAVEARRDMSAIAAQEIIAAGNERRVQVRTNPPPGSSGIDGRTVDRQSMSPAQVASSRPTD